MREIKFRAKASDKEKYGNDWIYGFYAHEPDGTHNLLSNQGAWHDGYFLSYVEIDIETLGQFTGLFDKNGNEIYENDIIRCMLSSGTSTIKYPYDYKVVCGTYGWYVAGSSLSLQALFKRCGGDVEVIGEEHERKH